MMTIEVVEQYIDYLEPQVGVNPRNGRGFHDLLNLMLAKEFVWLVPNDDNRIADGLDIRAEWEWARSITGPCSFLEVLIGLSRRIAFVTGENAEGWSWQLLINLELHQMRDPLTAYKIQKAEKIIEAVIWRTYHSTGEGGFFPLSHPEEDQRKVELWYQMSAYIREIHPEY